MVSDVVFYFFSIAAWKRIEDGKEVGRRARRVCVLSDWAGLEFFFFVMRRVFLSSSMRLDKVVKTLWNLSVIVETMFLNNAGSQAREAQVSHRFY